ncbi:hypothetical protein DPMN_015221 [Dreissena polymorpha]|uniref:Uncharacterized protein n=1 Tax=Dreissena polymorpha TaxID=45954 RepID=A0A9D4ND83_DREPO|nr:hypothetical protein DPMN_015221 [Dreissena polymorpha]
MLILICSDRLLIAITDDSFSVMFRMEMPGGSGDCGSGSERRLFGVSVCWFVTQ